MISKELADKIWARARNAWGDYDAIYTIIRIMIEEEYIDLMERLSKEYPDLLEE